MPLPNIPHPRVPPHHVRKSHPYASESRRLLMEEIKARFPDLEEALDQLKIMSMRFGGRKCHRIEQILSFIEDSILTQVSNLHDNDLKDLETELVEYNKGLEGCFEQQEDGKTCDSIISSLKEEQAHCRTLGDDTSKGGSMIAWVLNKQEDQGYSPPWEHSTNPSRATSPHPSSSAHSLEHRLTSRQKKVYL